MVYYLSVEVGKHSNCIYNFAYLFLNLLLNPARPISPDPKRSMLAGSGTTDSLLSMGCSIEKKFYLNQ